MLSKFRLFIRWMYVSNCKYLFILLALIALSTMRQRYVYRNHTIPQIIIGGGIGILLGVLSVNYMKETTAKKKVH